MYLTGISFHIICAAGLQRQNNTADQNAQMCFLLFCWRLLENLCSALKSIITPDGDAAI